MSLLLLLFLLLNKTMVPWLFGSATLIKHIALQEREHIFISPFTGQLRNELFLPQTHFFFTKFSKAHHLLIFFLLLAIFFLCTKDIGNLLPVFLLKPISNLIFQANYDPISLLSCYIIHMYFVDDEEIMILIFNWFL